MRSINNAGLELIKSFEGLRLSPYQDDKGIWTIGYGHINGINSVTSSISIMQAENFLKRDLAISQSAVERLVEVPLSDNQFSALVSLVFNLGTAPLLKTLGNKLNAADYLGAADEFLKWNHVGGIEVSGLTRRRIAERRLFLGN